MRDPVAVKMLPEASMDTHWIDATSLDLPVANGEIAEHAIFVTSLVKLLSDVGVVLCDKSQTKVVQEGDRSNAMLIVLPNRDAAQTTHISPSHVLDTDDSAFLMSLTQFPKELSHLAKETISKLRKGGIDGQLTQGSGGRWVNRPVNTFTIKVQPRKGDIQFTVYGEPHVHAAGAFLLKDQNSYSRGWIRNSEDIATFVSVVNRAQSLRGQ